MAKLIIGQVLGIIATIITFLSYQANTKKWVLIIQTIATALTCAAYFCLDAYPGLILNVVCIARNVSFYFLKESTKLNTAIAIGFAVIMAVLGGLSWQGLPSLLIIVALAINTIFLSFGKPQILRYSILLTSSMILAYNCFVFSIGGIANEGLAIISSIIGIIRFHKGTKETPKAENE